MLKRIKPIFKFTCVLQINKRYYLEHNTANLLVDYFGISHRKADYIVKNCKLKPEKQENVMQVLKFLHEAGVTKEEILECPTVLNIHPVTLDERYSLFEESGFPSIKPIMISKFRTVCNKNITHLKFHKCLPQYANVAENFKTYLKPLPDDFNVSDLTDEHTLSHIHLTVTQRYLLWRLQTTADELERLFRIYKMIKNKSMRYLCENLEIAEELGFEPQKLLKYGYLLHNYPKYTKTALHEFPNIAGADLKRAMRMYPKLVMIAPKNYIRIYGILKQHNIPDESIRRTMNIFHLSPETVELRLQEIESVPELRALQTNPKILKLIVHHNRARSRLSFLQQLELKCADVIVLGSIPSNFDRHVREGKDVNSLNDLFTFLKSLFRVKSFNVKRWKQHPFFQNIPFVQMEDTYAHLRKLKFTSKSILKVMHVILYPIENIDKAREEIRKNKNIRDRKLSQTQMLNLILYYVEKEHHFTGNGVWSTKHEEIDSKT